MEQRLRAAYDAASKRMKWGIGSATGSTSDPPGVVNAVVDQYDAAYRALVKAGLARQLRKKYRRP